jgi:hypothetical protein
MAVVTALNDATPGLDFGGFCIVFAPFVRLD